MVCFCNVPIAFNATHIFSVSNCWKSQFYCVEIALSIVCMQTIAQMMKNFKIFEDFSSTLCGFSRSVLLTQNGKEIAPVLLAKANMLLQPTKKQVLWLLVDSVS